MAKSRRRKEEQLGGLGRRYCGGDIGTCFYMSGIIIIFPSWCMHNQNTALAASAVS